MVDIRNSTNQLAKRYNSGLTGTRRDNIPKSNRQSRSKAPIISPHKPFDPRTLKYLLFHHPVVWGVQECRGVEDYCYDVVDQEIGEKEVDKAPDTVFVGGVDPASVEEIAAFQDLDMFDNKQ